MGISKGWKLIALLKGFAAVLFATAVTHANAGLITTTVDLNEYITTARNGDSPALAAAWTGGTDFFVRGRRGGASNNNTVLETQLFFDFDLSSIITDLQFMSAKLVLNQTSRLNTANPNADLFLATVTQIWDTSTNKPSFSEGATVGTAVANESTFGTNGPSASASVDRDFEIDLTTEVAAWLDGSQDNFGLRMRIENDFVAASFDPKSVQLVITQIPSPGTLALFGLGVAGLGWSRRKKV